MSGLFLTVVSPKIATEIAQVNPALTSERPKLLRRFLKPITGGLTIFDLDEVDWKPWRATFNKGFQTDRIISLVPAMVEETQVYADTLRALAGKGEMCFLEPLTLRFTIDMIGKTVLWVVLFSIIFFPTPTNNLSFLETPLLVPKKATMPSLMAC